MTFLSVVTRCYKRPDMLSANVDSLLAQTDLDYEQVFLVDEEGLGVYEANKRLATAEINGEYVLILDDDDMLTDPDAIVALKDATLDEPAIVFFKADHGPLGILPDAQVWQDRPIFGHVGSCDFITRHDWWARHIHAFGTPMGGDYKFLWSMWKEVPTVVWLDRQLAAVQRISRGAPA